MKSAYLRCKSFLIIFIAFTYSQIGFSQCDFTGLEPTYCITDDPDLLTGDPGGGTFSGPGMVFSTFDPGTAGVGIHTITYTIPAAEDKYYIKSNIGNPWGSTSNQGAMDDAFGALGWTQESFEAAVPGTVFAPTTSFVFLEGSDAHANELNTFLITNLALIETWVDEGGCILINAAPNEGSNINFGFGGTTLIYPSYENNVFGVDGAHPAFVGPELPTTTSMTGPYYSHGRITGAGLTNTLTNGTDIVLTEKAWGDGQVMFGGMTTSNWHSPAPHGNNFRANLLVYLNSLAVAVGCVVTQDVEVYALPDVVASVDDDEICEGEEVIFTGSGADEYTWDLGVIDGEPFTPIDLGLTTYTVTGTDLITGCQGGASVDVTVHELPTVTADVDFDEICIGEMVTFTGGGSDDYVWDVVGVTDGDPYEPAATGTVTYTVTGTNFATGCQNTASIDVTVFDLPPVVATATEVEICLGESVTFNGEGADDYVWDLGVTDGVAFTPAAAGLVTYTVIGTIGATGCENTATIDVLVNDLPTVTAAVAPDEICEGETITLTGGGADGYVWDIPGVTDGVAFTPAGAGTVDATVTGTNSTTGCENTAVVSFTVHPIPDVTASATTEEVCLTESVTLTGAGADTYSWSPFVTNGVPFTPGELGTTTYTVTGTTSEGCSSSATITITVIDCDPVIANFEFDNNICVGNCITITDISAGPVASWDWDFGGAVDPSTSTVQNPELCFNTIGEFTIQLTVTNATGATSSISNTITVNENPTIEAFNDTIIEIGDSAPLISNTASSGAYIWSPDDQLDCVNCPITSASPRESVTYTVNFTDENGCTAWDTVMVLVNFVQGVGVPTAFTPNGDGNNDVLFVKGFGIEAMSFTVYNRYGEAVFYSTDQNIGWDGTFKNREENPSVFTWVLQYTLNDGKYGQQKGNTTLLR
ncbi:MAG: T9SS type B sorting domain-containing protein [Crocinitomix sp.]|nr:T9SS type B sorting domain-containing protein [Crocinitomix sp.]